jgi:hypothetical protein
MTKFLVVSRPLSHKTRPALKKKATASLDHLTYSENQVEKKQTEGALLSCLLQCTGTFSSSIKPNSAASFSTYPGISKVTLTAPFHINPKVRSA